MDDLLVEVNATVGKFAECSLLLEFCWMSVSVFITSQLLASSIAFSSQSLPSICSDSSSPQRPRNAEGRSERTSRLLGVLSIR